MSWNSSCAVSVNVTPTTSGSKLNTTGNVSSTNGGTGNSASATLGAGDFTNLGLTDVTNHSPRSHGGLYPDAVLNDWLHWDDWLDLQWRTT